MLDPNGAWPLRRTLPCAVLSAMLAIGLLAADPGPPVGSRAPDFDLPDQNGVRQNLRSLAGPNGLMLVFYRSADW